MCDLVNIMGGWDWQRLHLWLSNSITQKIKEIIPPNSYCEDDEFLFAGAGSDGNSVKNMYISLVIQQEINDRSWRNIWKMEVQDRVRRFIWMLKHDRLLTNFNKSVKGL